ncbi:MAG: hypothetical protein ACRES9_09100 [Gammaproteobacteria bacterium]
MKIHYVLILPLFALTACSLGPQPPQVVGRMRAPIDFHAVRLYVPKCKPLRYKTVAKLDTSKLGVLSSYQFNLYWIKLLRKQAAGLGANGVLLIPLNAAVSSPGVYGSSFGPAFKASAIWEPQQAPAAGTSSWAARCLHAADLLRYNTGVEVGGPVPPGGG